MCRCPCITGESQLCPHLVPGQFCQPGQAVTSLSALLFSSSLSTACLAWTLTGSLAREATRRAGFLSPTWNCSAKQDPSQAPALTWAGEDWRSPAICLVCWCPCCSGWGNEPLPVLARHQLRGAPRPALLLSWFWSPRPCLRSLSTPALPAPAKEGGAGRSCGTQRLGPWGLSVEGLRKPCAPLARAPAF